MVMVGAGALIIAYYNPTAPGPWGILTQIVTAAAKLAGA